LSERLTLHPTVLEALSSNPAILPGPADQALIAAFTSLVEAGQKGGPEGLVKARDKLIDRASPSYKTLYQSDDIVEFYTHLSRCSNRFLKGSFFNLRWATKNLRGVQGGVSTSFIIAIFG
jgi:hypothetical protein